MALVEELRCARLEELTALKAAGRKVIGYLCIYAPVELIRAAGAIPVRLEHGVSDAERAGTKYVRSDACSFCKSCLGNFESDPLYRLTDAVVAVSTCDMMRRLPELIEHHFGRRVLQLYLPRTSEPLPHRVAELRRGLEHVRSELGEITGTVATDERMRAAIAEANRTRRLLRELDSRRAQGEPSTSRLLNLVSLAWLLDPSASSDLLERELATSHTATTRRPRLMIGGSMMTSDDLWLVELLERKADIVADFLCTGSRSFAEDVPGTADPMEGIADFYFNRVPCMHRRPNNALYDYARKLAAERHVAGVVYKTLLYCDSWSFEAQRLKAALEPLPFLHLDTDYSRENHEQVRTRVEAFMEML